MEKLVCLGPCRIKRQPYATVFHFGPLMPPGSGRPEQTVTINKACAVVFSKPILICVHDLCQKPRQKSKENNQIQVSRAETNHIMGQIETIPRLMDD